VPIPRPISLRMSATEWVMLLTLSVLWGCSFLFQKLALAGLPPLTVAFGRVAIAAVLLVAVVHGSGRSIAECRPIWPAIVTMGILNNVVPFSLIIWGQIYIPAGLASILIATAPMFAVLIAHLTTADEKVTSARLIGVGVGFLGVVIMLGIDLLSELGTNIVAQLACLGGALFYALSGVYGRRFRGHSPAMIAAGQLVASSFMLGLLVILVDRPWLLPAPPLSAIEAVVALSVLSTALAFLIYFRLLASAGAVNTTLVNLLLPATAILLAALILGERLAPRHFAGLAMIAVGLLILDGRPLRLVARAWRGSISDQS
jgi:drug/metabolite transporter (DMT)-like permease